MYAALSWVPRGAAKEKLPQGVKDDDDEADDMEITQDASEHVPKGPESANGDGNSPHDEGDGEVDIAQILSNDLDTLSFHKRDEKDPYLAADPRANEIFDDEELEDLVIRPTDSLIVAAKSGDGDASTLEVALFDDDADASDDEDGPYMPHVYVHHDIVIPVLPLCTAYTKLTVEGESLNLVAVGMFTPGIDIWDIDRVNNLEPVTSLGGFEQNDGGPGATAAAAMARSHNKSKKKKKKPKLRLKNDSHTDAVMCLSWNNVQREYLASGSADTTVKIWDIESTHCARTLEHHSDKVQAVSFHPSSAELLVSGSFDKIVQVVDVRDPSPSMSWSVESDVESCQWGSGPTEGLIVVSTEDGMVTVLDQRKAFAGQSGNVLAKWKAHDGAATSFSISSDISGLLVSGGVDKMVKVWDVSPVQRGQPGNLVYERPSKAGALFALSLCPTQLERTNASPFVVAFGGAKGLLSVADLAVESEAVRDRFIRHCSPTATAAIMKRVARGKRAPPRPAEDASSSGDSDVDEVDSPDRVTGSSFGSE